MLFTAFVELDFPDQITNPGLETSALIADRVFFFFIGGDLDPEILQKQASRRGWVTHPKQCRMESTLPPASPGRGEGVTTVRG